MDFTILTLADPYQPLGHANVKTNPLAAAHHGFNRICQRVAVGHSVGEGGCHADAGTAAQAAARNREYAEFLEEARGKQSMMVRLPSASSSAGTSQPERRDRPVKSAIFRRQDLDAGNITKLRGPAISEITQPGRACRSADAILKCNGVRQSENGREIDPLWAQS